MNKENNFFPGLIELMISKINLKAFKVLSIVLLLFFIAFNVFQVNLMTKESYLMQNYEKRIKEVSKENQILEINLSQKNSLSNLEFLLSDLSLEKIDKINYIQVLDSQVVTNK